MAGEHRTGTGDRDPGDPGRLPAVCPVKLYRCCGEGILPCVLQEGHTGFHTGVDADGWPTDW